MYQPSKCNSSKFFDDTTQQQQTILGWLVTMVFSPMKVDSIIVSSLLMYKPFNRSRCINPLTVVVVIFERYNPTTIVGTISLVDLCDPYKLFLPQVLEMKLFNKHSCRLTFEQLEISYAFLVDVSTLLKSWQKCGFQSLKIILNSCKFIIDVSTSTS